ncbi:MAG: tRNA (guanosine(37)-N1)-methyltransferase TrmD [Kiritimatiellia bacterium]
MRIDVLTVFPAMLDGFIRESMLKRAVQLGKVTLNTVDLRDYTQDVHRTTDDRPYGGGPGMVMKPDPIVSAVESIRTEGARVILMSPQGRVFRQAVARELVEASHLIFICGHYEGVDERVRQLLSAEELSIGDYVLTNGVLPAAVVVDAVVRLLPGVLGGEGAAEEESFSEGLLEYPHYTRPVEYRGLRVPDVLRSGNHAAVAAWRREQAEARTRERREDLLQ